MSNVLPLMKNIFDKVSVRCSQVMTKSYSTSFSLGILCLGKELRNPVYSIYGFVRSADEIVDSFEGYNKVKLLQQFKEDTCKAIDDGISLNPILNSFQATVHSFSIEKELIDSFLKSMEMDLVRSHHDNRSFQEYIHGSAEVVGLMCLRIFCKNDDKSYQNLKSYAMSLGAAFQKINFLRDLRDDYLGLGRLYFPDVDIEQLDKTSKQKIEQNIEKDFRHALTGIKKLPRTARFGVYVAYVYYFSLFKKIKNTPCELVMKNRIRIRNRQKATLLAFSYLKHQFNLI